MENIVKIMISKLEYVEMCIRDRLYFPRDLIETQKGGAISVRF